MDFTRLKKLHQQRQTEKSPITMGSLLKSFLSCEQQWTDSDKALLEKINRLIPTNPLMRWMADPSLIMTEAGIPPDPWQAEILRSNAGRILLLCSRQVGKSQTTAALVLKTAMLEPDSEILLLSPSEKQSNELLRKVYKLHDDIGCPVPLKSQAVTSCVLSNGSRITALPDNEKTVRCYSSVSLIALDEASRVPDSLYHAIRPMLAVSKGRVIALSTPFGKRGWFYDAWVSKEDWKRVEITADQCSRLTKEFLAEEKASKPVRWFRQEYYCSWEDTEDSVFTHADIELAMSRDVKPLFGVPSAFSDYLSDVPVFGLRRD
jgi:hypothetical protein